MLAPLAVKGPIKLVEAMWHMLAPLAVKGPILCASTTPYMYLFFLWEGYLHRPLRAHPLVKVR